MSQHDLPLWARGAAVGLLLFATWWLLDTEAIRSIVGASTALLSLGVISISILRGMHLPLGLWSTGPWRQRFSVPAVLAVGVVTAVLLLVSRARDADVLAAYLDVGMGVAVVAGAVALGFSMAFVRQRPHLKWYAMAIGAAILPIACTVLLGKLVGDGGVSFQCVALADQGDSTAGRTDVCVAGVYQAFLFFVVIAVPSKLVTEEIAFRRLLIGSAMGAGVVGILGSAIAAYLWYTILAWADVTGGPVVLLGTMAALSAGCLYVLSRSMVVSALFSGVFAAGYWVAAFVEIPAGSKESSIISAPSMWIPALIVAIAFCAVVYRRNGLMGNLSSANPANVSSN